MFKELGVVFFLFLFVVSSALSFRHNLGPSNKESLSGKSPRTRSEVFENLFIIYDPSFLSLVWPKITNGVHVNVDLGCWDDLSVFFKALIEGRAWAYSTVDASGRYTSGIFQGNRLWLGSMELCFRLDNEYVSRRLEYNNARSRREKDFHARTQDWQIYDDKAEAARDDAARDDTPSLRLAYVAVQLLLNITKFKVPKHYEIALGLCLPRSCSAVDVASLIKFSIMLNDNLKTNGSVPRSVKLTTLRQIEEYYDLRYDTGAVLVIFFTLILLTLAVTSTVVDYGLIKCIRHQNRTKTLNIQKYDNTDKSYKHQSRKHTREVVADVKELKGQKAVVDGALKINRSTPKLLNPEALKILANVNEIPPSITLDVVIPKGHVASCNRCGKYKKQCTIPKQLGNLSACPRVAYNPCASLTNTEYRSKDNIFLNLLLSFSLKHNCKRIFNTTMANQDLAVVHLLRIISTFWVIFIHVSTLMNYFSENYEDENEGRNAGYHVLTTGTLAFDTLFFVSGMFSAHHFFYLSSRYTLRELVSCGGQCGKLLQFVCFVTNRSIRLLPPYIYTIFLTAVLSRVWRDTAATMFPEKDYENCDKYWWRNLLYITLFYPQKEQCMQISWYLSTETLLHVCGALLCVLMTTKRRRSAVLSFNAVLLAATAFDVIQAFADYYKRFRSIFEGYFFYIQRPLARVAPYLIGVLAGWLVHRVDGRTRVSKMTSCFLWLACVSTLVTSLAVSLLSGHWSCAWLHAAWPAALLWPALVCSTDCAGTTRRFLACGGVAALSRLSYCTLLLHGAAARWLLLAAGRASCSNAACLWSYFTGTSLLSLLAALLLSLLLEMPCCSLLRRICDYAYS